MKTLLLLMLCACSPFATAGVLWVQRLDDDVKSPREGSLRWALLQKGPREVRFAVAGTIQLKASIRVKHSRVTLDGSDAPGLGVCIAGGALEFIGVHDIALRHLRVRLGDAPGLRANRWPWRWRPANSEGLDCVSFHECQRVLVEHCSFSWSCDELLSVVRCQDVTVRWCLLSEPLGWWRLHPYGNHHAFAFNASASTLRVEHCLFAHYIMRGPQFEANDMRHGDDWPVRMEAIDNVMFDFKSSGSRVTMGVEDHVNEALGRRFDFSFTGNRYFPAPDAKGAIQGTLKHGEHGGVHVRLSGNASGLSRVSGLVDDKGRAMSSRAVKVSSEQGKSDDLAGFLARVGCSVHRDAVDERVVRDVQDGRYRRTLKSMHGAGGWPRLGL